MFLEISKNIIFQKIYEKSRAPPKHPHKINLIFVFFIIEFSSLIHKIH
jgi:hypothetical protein